MSRIFYAKAGDEQDACAAVADNYFKNSMGEAVRDSAPHSVRSTLYRVTVEAVDPAEIPSKAEVCGDEVRNVN